MTEENTDGRRVNNKSNRRSVLKSIGAGGAIPLFAMQTGTAAESDCDAEPYWAGDGNEYLYDDFDYADEHVKTGGLIDGASPYAYPCHIDSGIGVKKYDNDSGDVMFRVGISGYGYPDECYSGGPTCNGVDYHGASIDVQTGSLYASLNSNKILVWPEIDDSSNSSVLADMAWTAIKDTVTAGLTTISPYANYPIIAADVMASGVFNNDDCMVDDNYVEYVFDHTSLGCNSETTKKSKYAGHFVDVQIDPVNQSAYRPKQATLELTQYVNYSRDDYFNNVTTGDQTALVQEEYKITSASIRTQSTTRRELSDDEIKEMDFPDHFKEGGSIYVDSGGSIEKISENKGN
ncbi:hypothetical protein [Natrinema sp. SYSU A 869]|uniref:hypothetical protein n=1 Tax=Natrinema sp. SYSU A 869 TaxID=2871694 RepID=UPI001CA3D5B6|nr:hypothetical protein [Natrinema sp. SYSU A 869]